MATVRVNRKRKAQGAREPSRPSRRQNIKSTVSERAIVKNLDDKELVRLSQGGDHRAFEELVNRYRDRLFWVAYNMTGNNEEARDISQEAFVRIFKAIDRYNPKYKFYTWAYQITANMCIDYLRKRSLANVVSFEALSSDTYKVEFPADGPPVGENLERRELIERIQRILNKLPVKYKTVLVLRDLEGMHCREIAKVVRCSYPTLRWRLFQARKLFKAAWEREFRLEKDFQRHIPKRATGKSL